MIHMLKWWFDMNVFCPYEYRYIQICMFEFPVGCTLTSIIRSSIDMYYFLPICFVGEELLQNGVGNELNDYGRSWKDHSCVRLGLWNWLYWSVNFKAEWFNGWWYIQSRSCLKSFNSRSSCMCLAAAATSRYLSSIAPRAIKITVLIAKEVMYPFEM